MAESGFDNPIVDLIEALSAEQRTGDYIYRDVGLTAEDVKEGIVWDVKDTMDNVVPAFTTFDADTARMSVEHFVSLLSTHSEVWFRLGLHWAREHG